MVAVGVYEVKGHARSMTIARAFVQGLKAAGEGKIKHFSIGQSQNVSYDCDVAVFYGFAPPMKTIMEKFVSDGRKAVHIDLGYWGRVQGGNLKGYHKVAVNARHPTEYFQSIKHDDRRVRQFGLHLRPWRGGSHIVVAGMSSKHCKVEGIPAQSWEMEVIQSLSRYTDRPIYYRPKPSDPRAFPIANTRYCRRETVDTLLEDCHAVVSHHSNMAVDGAVLGVPNFSSIGVATAIGLTDFSKIEEPIYPEERQQFLNDVAYCQWNVDEMRDGSCWRHLRDEGVV